LEPRFKGKGSSLGKFFGFYKTRHILLSDSANCTVLRAVVLTIPAYDRRTDGQTDGITVASTALAMSALRRAVKINGVGQLLLKLLFVVGWYLLEIQCMLKTNKI